MILRRKMLITGASSRLGEQTARTFAVGHRDLALCARRTGRLQTHRDVITRAPIAVVTSHLGYIATDVSASPARTPLKTSSERGVRAMAEAIERRRPEGRVLAGPWTSKGKLARPLPLRLVVKAS
ncbi:hypothetical protein [Streptomyces cyaneofuscatus]